MLLLLPEMPFSSLHFSILFHLTLIYLQVSGLETLSNHLIVLLKALDEIMHAKVLGTLPENSINVTYAL